MIVNSGIHVFRIQNCALRFWNTVKNLESEEFNAWVPESFQEYEVQGVE